MKPARYVWYGTNSFNFPGLSLADPPRFRATKCRDCRRKVIKQAEGWTEHPDGTTSCAWCSGFFSEVQGDVYESGEEEEPLVVDADVVEL